MKMSQAEDRVSQEEEQLASYLRWLEQQQMEFKQAAAGASADNTAVTMEGSAKSQQQQQQQQQQQSSVTGRHNLFDPEDEDSLYGGEEDLLQLASRILRESEQTTSSSTKGRTNDPSMAVSKGLFKDDDSGNEPRETKADYRVALDMSKVNQPPQAREQPTYTASSSSSSLFDASAVPSTLPPELIKPYYIDPDTLLAYTARGIDSDNQTDIDTYVIKSARRDYESVDSRMGLITPSKSATLFSPRGDQSPVTPRNKQLVLVETVDPDPARQATSSSSSRKSLIPTPSRLVESSEEVVSLTALQVDKSKLRSPSRDSTFHPFRREVVGDDRTSALSTYPYPAVAMSAPSIFSTPMSTFLSAMSQANQLSEDIIGSSESRPRHPRDFAARPEHKEMAESPTKNPLSKLLGARTNGPLTPTAFPTMSGMSPYQLPNSRTGL